MRQVIIALCLLGLAGCSSIAEQSFFQSSEIRYSKWQAPTVTQPSKEFSKLGLIEEKSQS